MTRTSAEIGAGLAPARPARAVRTGERIHVIGAAGAGASAAALLAHAAGAFVSGCDAGGPSPYSVALEVAGVPVAWSHDPGHVSSAERLAVTKALTSIHPDHPELRAGRRLGIPMEAWQQVIADAAATRHSRLIAVAGTHGKSTSTGWLTHVLTASGRDPSAFVGALLDAELTGGVASTARWGAGTPFVVEADEYAGNFDAYRPEIAVLLNAEWDHPDVFPDEDAVLDAFERWLRAPTPPAGRSLVANVGNPGVRRLIKRLGDWHGRILGVGFGGGELRPTPDRLLGRLGHGHAGAISLELASPDGATATARIPLAGRHNAENALGVAGAAWLLGVPLREIAETLGTFRGVGRRLEVRGEAGGVVVLDDYAHHPTAIAVTMEAARERYPGRRLWAVYEPLTYHRTAAMEQEFAAVLSTADRVAIAEIWAGRDPDTTIASAEGLAAAVTARGGAPAFASGSPEATADALVERVRPGDVVLVMGGGRSYVIAERLSRALGERSQATPGKRPGTDG